jgi:hypothetical protein
MQLEKLNYIPHPPPHSSPPPISPVSRQRNFTEKRTRRMNNGKIQYNEGSEYSLDISRHIEAQFTEERQSCEQYAT